MSGRLKEGVLSLGTFSPQLVPLDVREPFGGLLGLWALSSTDASGSAA